MRQPWVFSSILLVGDSSADFPEEVAHFLDEQIRLLERGEMTALRHLAPVRDVGITRFHPLAHRRYDFPEEHPNTGRHLDGMRCSPLRPETFPIEPRR